MLFWADFLVIGNQKMYCPSTFTRKFVLRCTVKYGWNNDSHKYWSTHRHTQMHTHTRSHTHSHTHTHICTHTRTHTHTRTDTHLHTQNLVIFFWIFFPLKIFISEPIWILEALAVNQLFALPCSKWSVAHICCTHCVTVRITNLFCYHSEHMQWTVSSVATSWFF